jgi:DNA-binding transcriptional MerR regulator
MSVESKALPAIPAKRYFTIGEVSELCGVKAYVLRYWEQEFTQLKPMKRRGNRRYYQHHEVLLIRRIRDLLYEQGFTISGARNQLTEGGHAHAAFPAAVTRARTKACRRGPLRFRLPDPRRRSVRARPRPPAPRSLRRLKRAARARARTRKRARLPPIVGQRHRLPRLRRPRRCARSCSRFARCSSAEKLSFLGALVRRRETPGYNSSFVGV